MTGPWLMSYVLLWVVVVVLGLLLVGVLRQLGQLRLQLGLMEAESDDIPSVAQDGPPIGARLPDLTVQTINGYGSRALADRGPTGRAHLLVMLMTPLCAGCQRAVEPLNALARDPERRVEPVVVMRADEQGCRSFLSVFPLDVPTVCDSDRTITRGFDVRHAPFGLLYDADELLIRKGIVETQDDLMALLGDAAAPAEARERTFPPVLLSMTERQSNMGGNGGEEKPWMT